MTLSRSHLQPLYDVFAAYAAPPIQPADAPLPEAEEGQGLAPRTAGMLQLSPQAWRALLEETQLMLRSGEGMHAPGVWAAANFFDDVRGARRGTIPGYYDGKDPLTLTPFT